MTKTIAIKGMTGVEHAQAGGSFVAYLPEEPVPTPIKAGDRLHVRLEVADDTWLYAVAVVRQADYWKLGAWAPIKAAGTGVRMLWPGGHALTAADARMTTLLVVASTEELPWIKDLTRADCSSLVNKMPPDPPVTACDHLYGLFWKVPKQPRGLVPPEVDFFDDAGKHLPAIVATHSGAPYLALAWQFKPRP
jgi:hypothetical protein